MGRLGEAWAPDTDLENRDPNNLNDHLKVRLVKCVVICLAKKSFEG